MRAGPLLRRPRARGTRRHRDRLFRRDDRQSQTELRRGGGTRQHPQDGRSKSGIRGRDVRPHSLQEGRMESPGPRTRVQGMAQGAQDRREDDPVRRQLLPRHARRGLQSRRPLRDHGRRWHLPGRRPLHPPGVRQGPAAEQSQEAAVGCRRSDRARRRPHGGPDRLEA